MDALHADEDEEAVSAAVALLRRNISPLGILAATPTPRAEARHYTRVFGRDAAICALGMAVSGEADLLDGAERGLRTLAAHQAANGQIPKYVDPEGPDFWYVGCIDATLWWLIAVDFLARHGRPALRATLAGAIARALVWAQCQEHPRLGLVQQNEASDWADIMPRSGFVLYSNALWYYVKQRYALPDAEITRFHFNHLFYPFSRELPDYKRLRLLTHYVRQCHRSRSAVDAPSPHPSPGGRGGGGARRDLDHSELYLSFVNFATWGEEGDVFGNLLALLLGLASDGPAHRILHALQRAAIDTPLPVRAVCRPIVRDSRLWRPYMDRHQQNLAFCYHNGGSWPFIGGFWVLALAAQGRATAARAAFRQVAAANRRNGWEFNEWFHGATGEPQGMVGQSWNAAMLLLARYGLTQRVF